VVANVLLRRPATRIFARPAFRNGYEVTRVHGVDVARVPAEKISNEKVYSDAILADFASVRHPTHAVLTVYRPYPYADGRSQLESSPTIGRRRDSSRSVAGFGPRPGADDIGLRVARWGTR
jgi:hypothetical protein